LALFLYALLPLLANSKAGFAMIDPAVLDVARGMGMSSTSIFFTIELPLAATAIVGGFRTALAQNMGNAVLAGLVGGGGLGSLIFLGLAQAAPDLVMLGAIAVALSAFGVDKAFGWMERRAGAITGVI
jgi:osmoprotectant transport system permease protein